MRRRRAARPPTSRPRSIYLVFAHIFVSLAVAATSLNGYAQQPQEGAGTSIESTGEGQDTSPAAGYGQQQGAAMPPQMAMPQFARSPWNFDRLLTIRATPMTGFREPLSLSVAWSRHSVLEAELGIFGDPFAKRTTVTDGVEQESREFAWGAYLRGGLSVLVRDHRDNLSRPWTLEIPVLLGVRTLSQRGDVALFLTIHTGLEAVRWLKPNRGVTMGVTIGSPYYELTEGVGVGLTPIIRGFIGLAL